MVFTDQISIFICGFTCKDMMSPETAAKLLTLNRQFYQTLGPSFSSTRQHIQPGVRRILTTINPDAPILDLGCGNGALVRALTAQGHRARYVGVDFSAELLSEASQNLPASLQTGFIQADLADPDWDAAITADSFQIVLAFAVLHHLPGYGLRKQVVQRVHSHLLPGGRLVHSHWQFLNSARLRKRIQPYYLIGISPEEVETDDYLLDWRHGGYGLRYVHHASIVELQTLAAETGFAILETFYCDGETGKLGLYQVWEAMD